MTNRQGAAEHDALHQWHAPLSDRAATGAPLWWGADHTTSAVLAGMRPFVERFRAAGLGPGDRLVLALEPGPTYLAALAASLWDDLTVVLADPRADPVALAVAADPSLALVGPGGLAGRTVPWAIEVDPLDPVGLPDLDAFDASHRRSTVGPPSVAARVLVPPSSPGPLVALSSINLSVCATAVVEALEPTGSRWLSTMPWNRAEGLVVDAMAALFGVGEVVRPLVAPSDPGWLDAVTELLEAAVPPTRAVFAVPLVRALVERFGGAGPLTAVHDGLVVGPGVDGELAHVLAGTRLRPARGAAELSGLVTIGEPGLWRAGVAGRARTCDARPDGHGGLSVTGLALALGTFDEGHLTILDPSRVLPARFS